MASTIKVTNIDTPDSTGNITVDRPLSGSGASLTALNATQLTTGTIPIARLGNDVIDSQHYVAASIDNEHLADDAVGVAELSATGTASSSTFLRGDNAWAAPAGVTPKVKMIHTTYAFSGPPGTQTLSGVGFAPDLIYGMWGVGNTDLKGPCIFWAINPSSSLAQSGTRNFNAWQHNEGMTADSWRWANSYLAWSDDANNYFGATVTTWGSDGVTITYTKTGSPATGPTMNQGTVFFKLT